ncbi:hypothetical protein EDB89DRAFT_1912027 [Lactarius sanguifluus]|nr:hypothetical protein EDB89DRAFT_1912027 [Lactarius sanguifluus]
MPTQTTPPNSNSVPTGISLGTPVHTRSSTTGFLNTKYLTRDDIYNAMSLEMSPFFLGPMPPQLFLSTFLLSSKALSSEFKAGMFDALANLWTEVLMYKVFTGLPPTFYDQVHKTDLRANSTVSNIWIEFKSKAEEDAFLSKFPDRLVLGKFGLVRFGPVLAKPETEPFNFHQTGPKPEPNRFKPLQTIPNHFKLIKKSQTWFKLGSNLFGTVWHWFGGPKPQTEPFSLFSEFSKPKPIKRFGGAIVTAPIYYQLDPKLFDFFIRYNQAERQERGHDNSIRKATPEETLKAVTADTQFHNTQEDLFVVTIPRHTYGSGCSNFIIKPPVCQLYTPPGCVTHTSIAFDIKRNSVVFFKDSWRVACNGMEREGDIYKTLNNTEIPNIPRCAASGDVGVDTYHSTSHRDTFEKCKILHCDISPNNILLTESTDFNGGLLINWDLWSARQATCTGTWQFMATDLIKNPEINQTFIHDIESAFFVLLWMALHYLHSSWDVDGLSSFVDTVFNPQVYGNTGGLTKLMFMRVDQGLNNFSFTNNVPLADLLCGLKELLSVRHKSQPTYAHKSNIKDVIHQAWGIRPSSMLAAANEQAYKSVLEEYELYLLGLDNHETAIFIIENAINKEDTWPAFEPANRQRLLLSHAVKWGLRLGSKRCREATLECEGGDLMEWQSLPKQNKILPKQNKSM